MISLKKLSLVLLIVCITMGSLCFAQPHIPKKDIPSNIPKDVRQLIERLYSEDSTLRADSARELGDMGEKAIPAIPFLIEMLDDAIPVDAREKYISMVQTVSMSIQYALEKIGAPAVEPLIEASLKNKNLHIRSGAAEVLGKIRDSRAVEPLIYILKGQDSQTKEEIEVISGVRIAAAYALGGIKDIQAVELLISYLNNKNKYLRDQAEISLRDIILTVSIKDEYKNISRIGDEGFLTPLLDNRLGKDRIKWHKWWEENKDKFNQFVR